MSIVITDIGISLISARLKGLNTEPLNIGWGTGVTAPTSADVILESEDATPGYSRTVGVSTITSISITNDTYQVSGAQTALAGLQITEWGLFDSAGNLLCREVQVPGFAIGIGEILNFVFKIQNARC